MGDKIYDILDKNFSKYMNIMENCREDNSEWNEYCKNINNKFLYATNQHAKEKMCHKVMEYLYYIYNDFKNPLEKNGLIYLYYWIHKYHLNAEKNINSIREFYEELLNIYKKTAYFINDIDEHEYKIFYKELKIFTYICDLNIRLYGIKNNTFVPCKKKQKCDCADDFADIYMRLHNACESNGDRNFCETLEDITLPYSRTSTKQAILIPFTIILIISLLILILNKVIYYFIYKYLYDKMISINKLKISANQSHI
ncbi:variable surface protein [Plasmodium gonderi]|uniref:Variable surface protein n=1 Tax=Plasmodium gonderi TaxID=77519 RepID=A0A1Y1JPG9_PLAGO|nr:variable surface protein [Plasmodium gonderi]GAW84339.1 variable surface protein [Plasmodium gonderi]